MDRLPGSDPHFTQAARRVAGMDQAGRLQTPEGIFGWFLGCAVHPAIPKILQKLFFGSLGGIQAIVGLPFLPMRWGESIMVVARKLPMDMK